VCVSVCIRVDIVFVDMGGKHSSKQVVFVRFTKNCY